MKYLKIISFFFLALIINTAEASSIGKFMKAKGKLKSNDGDIHITRFIGDSSEAVSTHASISLGKWDHNMCKPVLSAEEDVDIVPGEEFVVCGDCLKEDVGSGVSCAIEQYKNNKTGKSTSISYQIFWDGSNYTGAAPSEHIVPLE